MLKECKNTLSIYDFHQYATTTMAIFSLSINITLNSVKINNIDPSDRFLYEETFHYKRAKIKATLIYSIRTHSSVLSCTRSCLKEHFNKFQHSQMAWNRNSHPGYSMTNDADWWHFPFSQVTHVYKLQNHLRWDLQKLKAYFINFFCQAEIMVKVSNGNC